MTLSGSWAMSAPQPGDSAITLRSSAMPFLPLGALPLGGGGMVNPIGNTLFPLISRTISALIFTFEPRSAASAGALDSAAKRLISAHEQRSMFSLRLSTVMLISF